MCPSGLERFESIRFDSSDQFEFDRFEHIWRPAKEFVLHSIRIISSSIVDRLIMVFDGVGENWSSFADRSIGC